MPMREDCKNFQSRTYNSGEVARFCVLGLAPDAPWSCPDNCPMYTRRLADAGWHRGTLIEPKLEDRPEQIDSDDADAVLDAAEELVNEVGPQVISDFNKKKDRKFSFRKKK
jgi:hypothetical protein